MRDGIQRLLPCVLALTLGGYGNVAEAAGPPPPPPAATTIVDYDFNSGSSYSAFTPELASGTTSTASSTQPLVLRSGTATDGSAFSQNASGGAGVGMADSSGSNTKYFQFQLGGASLALNRRYKVYVQAQRNAGGATTLTLAYSTNGTTFTNAPATLGPAFGTFVSQVFDLSAVTALDHQGTIYFRLLASGASVPASELVIDNFQVQAEVVLCPSTFTVAGTGDAPDVDPGDGVCADASGACTLRAALAESNALTSCSAQTVNISALGTIALSSGLPTITRPVTIAGPGAHLLAVSGDRTFRLMNILLTAPGAVAISDISLIDGGKGAGENATALEFNNNGTLAIDRVEFAGNAGSGSSSVIFTNASAGFTMTGSTVRDSAVEHVVVIGNTPFTIANSTIANNTGTGAGIFLFGGPPTATISSTTITNVNNGLWHANAAGASTVTIRNSIFSQNSINLRRTGVATCAVNGIVSGGFNLIDSDPAGNLCSSTATDLIGSSFNPQLSPLEYHGGTTRTRAPAPTSPAIDKGNSFGDTADQRGSRRAYDTPGIAAAAGGDSADIGAVEMGFVVNSLADTGDATPDGVCDSGSGVCTLREAIQEANATTVGDTISFATGLSGTIALGSGLPTITRPVSILGPGANVLAIGGNHTFRLINILLAAPGAVRISDISLVDGGKGAGENATALEFNNSGTLAIDRVEFAGNTGPAGSSVIFSNAAAGLILNGSTVGDSAVEHVIVIGNTPFTIASSTIANNTGTGAGIFLFGGPASATITSATLTNLNNGIWHANAAGASSVTIRNSIFSQNSVNLRRTGVTTCAVNGIVSGGFNLIDSDPGSSLCVSTSTDLIGSSFNPQLTPLGSFGGTTRTRALLGNSPAIDRGHRFDVATDQRGQARPFDNPGIAPAAGGDNSDIGAFELQAACGAVTLGPASLPNGKTTVNYSQQLTAAGASAPFTFSVASGALPPGLTLAANGALSGTPGAAGTFVFTALATSANGCYGTKSYTLVTFVPRVTTTAVTSSSNPAEQFSAVTFTATVSQTDVPAIAPDGTVAFNFGDGTPVVPVACVTSSANACRAAASHTFMTGATFSVTAHYGGGTSHAPSDALPVSQVVNACTINPVVTTGADSGPGSLRDALANVCSAPNNAITFDTNAFSGPITLTGGELAPAKDVVIIGPGAKTLAITREGSAPAFRIFHITPGRTFAISGVTISNGWADNPMGGWEVYGGGILVEDAAATVTATTIAGNQAGYGAGIAIFTWHGPASLSVADSTISGNLGWGTGGGVWVSQIGSAWVPRLTMTNSTVSGNQGGSTGGGLALFETVATLTNVTITANTLRFGGSFSPETGGLFAQGPNPPFTPALNVILRNSIVAGNSGSDGDVAGPINGSSASNLVGSTASIANGVNGNIVGADPRLGPLADNGGQTQTHALLLGSAAIDAGDNQFLTAPHQTPAIANDQRGAGVLRIADGLLADAGPTVDIGAYEVQPALGNLSDRATLEDALPIFFDFPVGADADTVVATSSNSGLVDTAGLAITGSGTTRTLTITPKPNANGTATITVTASKTVSGTTSSTSNTFVLTVTPVNDAPTIDAVGPVSVNEDAGAQTIVLTGITVGGNLFGNGVEVQGLTVTATSDNPALIPDPGIVWSGDPTSRWLGYTPAANAFGTAHITVTVNDSGGTSDGGVDVTSRTFTITVNPVADTPSITNAVTLEDTQTAPGQLAAVRNAVDGSEVTHVKVTAISHGTLFLADGVTQVAGGSFVAFADAAAGFRFTPLDEYSGTGSFDIQASTSGTDAGLGGDVVTATVAIGPVADTPSVTPATTLAEVQTTSGLVVSRHPADGIEVPYFKITGIQHGTLFQNDGVTPINDGDFITVDAGNAGLKFTPAAGFGSATASFDVQASLSAGDSGLGGGVATAAITVNPHQTTTTVVSANPNPSDRTQPFTVVYTVVNDDGSPAPAPSSTVTVSFIDSPNESCTGTVADGQCTLIASSAGSRFIRAHYNGEPMNAASTSSAFSHPVNECSSNPIVTSTADDGSAGTLRHAVTNVCFDHAITFDIDGAGPHTIQLNGTPITIAKKQTITGSSDGIVVSGAASTGLLLVDPGVVATLDRLTLRDGQALHGGAILNQGTLTIRNSTLAANTAQDGGAIWSSGALTILGSTLSGNTANGTSSGAGLGGAIFNQGTLILAHGTMTANSANLQGGGISGTGVTIANSVVAGNTAPFSPNLDPGFTGFGFNITSGDPRLGALQDNGGPTATHLPLPGSPVFDAGDQAVTDEAGLTTDQRGLPRVRDGAGDAAAVVDVGSVETDPVVSKLTDLSTQEDVPVSTSVRIGDVSTPFDSIVATSDNTTVVANDGSGFQWSGTGTARTLTVTPVANRSGVAAITVTAAKTVGGITQTFSSPFTLTVTAANDPPTLDPIPAQAPIREDAEPQAIPLTGISAGPLESQSVTVRAVSSNQALVADPVVLYSSPSATATLLYAPATNLSGTATITVTVRDAQGSTFARTLDVTVTPVADPPAMSNVVTDEDVTATLVVGRSPLDGPEVTHLKFVSISGGTLFKADGVTPIPSQAFITIAEGAAGLRFKPSPNSLVTGHVVAQASIGNTDAGLGGPASADIFIVPVADAPAVTPATTTEDTQTASGLVLSRNAVDGAEVTHFGITAIANGSLFQHDGVTPIHNGEVITFAQGNAGLRFTPSPDFSGSATFVVQGATSASGTGTGAATTASITVMAVADTPSIGGAATTVNQQTTSGLAAARNIADGAEVTHLKVTAVSGGALFQHDGTTAIPAGTFITFAQGAAGLRFTPAANSIATGHVSIQASTTATDAGLGGSPVTADIVVNPIASTTTVATSGSPSQPGQLVTFTATVTPALAAAGGTVQFKDGSTPLGAPVALSSAGVATFATSSLTVGVHQISAIYSGYELAAGSTGALAGGQVVSGGRAVLTGAGAGGGPHVRRFGALDGSIPTTGALSSFFAFDLSFAGGVRVASGDVNGDGEPDYVAAPGPGAPPEIHVYDGATGTLLRSVLAFETGFRGGVFVAAGDVNGDGYSDVIAGSGEGRRGQVRVFSGTDGSVLRDAFVFDPSFTDGVRVAAGDVNGDGLADLIAGSGPGAAASVTILSGSDLAVLRTFAPYGAFAGGVFVAAGDVDGDGFADVITGAGAGGGPHVQVFNGVTGAVVQSFFAFATTFTGGVRVAAGDVNGDGKADVIAGAGPGGSPEVRVFDAATAAQLSARLAYPAAFPGGVFVATAVPVNRMTIERAGGGVAVATGPAGADRRPNMIAGWAGIEGAGDAGVQAVHVWALPVAGGASTFLGVATQGDPRPDVAARFGPTYANSGFHLTFPSHLLPAGTYDIAVFAQGQRTGTFQILRINRITVTP